MTYEELMNSTMEMVGARRMFLADIKKALEPLKLRLIGTKWDGGISLHLSLVLDTDNPFLSAESDGLL